MKVPGAVPVLDRADVHTADDDKFFNFDVDRGLVFFKKELVDLVRKHHTRRSIPAHRLISVVCRPWV